MEEKAFDAFISHSSKDAAIASAVKQHLQTARIRCWKAPDDIQAGESWPLAIQKALSSSRIMVLIWSTHSSESQDVLKELTLAMRNNLTIIPFRIEDLQPFGEWDYHLVNTHWMDAFPGSLDEYLDHLQERILAIIPDRKEHDKKIRSIINITKENEIKRNDSLDNVKSTSEIIGSELSDDNSRFDIKIIDPGPKKTQVIKEIRAFNSELSSSEAEEIICKQIFPVLFRINTAQLNIIKEKLELLGATIETKIHSEEIANHYRIEKAFNECKESFNNKGAGIFIFIAIYIVLLTINSDYAAPSLLLIPISIIVIFYFKDKLNNSLNNYLVNCVFEKKDCLEISKMISNFSGRAGAVVFVLLFIQLALGLLASIFFKPNPASGFRVLFPCDWGALGYYFIVSVNFLLFVMQIGSYCEHRALRRRFELKEDDFVIITK